VTQFVVHFESEQEAQRVMKRLEDANVGEVRMRVMDDSGEMEHSKDENTSPMITSDMGGVEVRPTETPKTPHTQQDYGDDPQDEATAAIPTTGTAQGKGVQVMIEVSDEYEEIVRRLLQETA
jgi:hypothetical protein